MKLKYKLMIIVVAVIACGELSAAEEKWGYVDGSVLISLHPLMKQYDPETRRFRDTVSECRPDENPLEYIARLRNKLEKTADTIAQLDSNYAGRISEKNSDARNIWWSFWKKRESVKIYHMLIQETITQAAIHGNFYLNMPSEWTLMPVTSAIASSINDVCEYLRKERNLHAILDASVFLSRSAGKSPLNLIPNLHWKLWSGNSVESSELEMISDSFAGLLRKSFSNYRHRPFVGGAIDLRGTSEALLSDVTLPSADLPGNYEQSGE